MSNCGLPHISIIIPTFNESGYILNCIKSVIKSNYPRDKIELLIIDGGSTDGTVESILSREKTYPEIRLIHNPKKIVPAAINIGVKNSSHDIIVWLGAHAIYDKDYLKNAINILQKDKPASVGGVIIPVGKNYMGNAIATATSTKFGIGNAKYRHSKLKASVDTVFGGCWYKSTVLKIGGFDEKWARNQDFEFNYRLRKEIGEILLDPSIKCYYYCRDSIPSLAKQYFNYGFWRYKTTKKHPETFSVRQLAPLLLFISFVVSAALIPLNLTASLIAPIIYCVATALTSLSAALSNKKLAYIVILPIIFFTIHFSWAAGFIISAIKSTYTEKVTR